MGRTPLPEAERKKRKKERNKAWLKTPKGKEMKRKQEMGTIAGVMRRYRQRAKDRNLEWNLSRQEVEILFSQPCFYCGESVKHKYNEFAGIDRVNNLWGYFMKNVVPCCGFCNIMKGKVKIGEFYEKIRLIYHHRICKLFGQDEEIL